MLTNDISDPDAPETFTVVAVNGALADANGNTAPIATSSGGFVRLVNFQITYTSPTAPGSDSFSYTISDGRGGTASAQVQVEVIPVFDYGDAPDSYGTLFDSDGTGTLLLARDLALFVMKRPTDYLPPMPMAMTSLARATKTAYLSHLSSAEVLVTCNWPLLPKHLVQCWMVGSILTRMEHSR